MATTITIGRAPGNTIVVGNSFQTVSNNHAELTFQDDGRLKYTDHSSNGTVINGLEINNKSVFVTTDDIVRLADSFPIDWQEVYKLIPELARADSKRTRRINPNASRQEPAPEVDPEAISQSPVPDPRSTQRHDYTATQPVENSPAHESKANPRMTQRHNFAETMPIEQPVKSNDDRSTERFDRSGSDLTNCTTSADFGTRLSEDQSVKPVKKQKKRNSSNLTGFRHTPWGTILLCFVAFLAVMAILAFTVFDDVVKNIM
ncbi:MAG: FHA domain-containing protein [Odoribacter sp.]|nr:FHA domain-containing protein [Odoribacter sp.]